MTGPGDYAKLFIDGAWATPVTTEVKARESVRS
jgi:hypothetical protein